MPALRTILVTALAAALYVGCGLLSDGSPPDAEEGGDADTGAEASGPPDASFVDGRACANLECNVRKDCGRRGNTRIRGKVFDPAGVNPLYGVFIYVPNAPLEPLPNRVSCDRCGAPVSGHPVTIALTGSDGAFTLENAPGGAAIPLVMQVGKWRRQVTIPYVAHCEDTVIDDPSLLRLPRSRSEGDMPQIAIVTGAFDPFECLLRKIGISGSELTSPSAPGAVHFYKGLGGTDVVGGAPPAATLYDDPERLAKYDVVLLPCEATGKTEVQRQHIVDYANVGGRVFATDFGVLAWIQNGADRFPETAEWGGVDDGTLARIDMSFPKGLAMAEWLVGVGGATKLGELVLDRTFLNIKTERAPSQRWIVVNENVKSYTFNTPIGEPEDKQCGRVVASDFHVSGGERQGATCPNCCRMAPMTAQEKALEFMFFDVSSCVLPDHEAPTPPVIK